MLCFVKTAKRCSPTSEELHPPKNPKGTLKMVAVNSWSFGLTGHSSARPRFHWTDASAMSQNKIQTLAVVLIDSWQQSGWLLDSQVVRLLFYFFPQQQFFVKICMRGARRSPPAYRRTNNCTHFSSVKTFVFSYADYSLCIFYWVIWMPYMSAPPCPLAFFFPFFLLPLGKGGKTFWFQLERKTCSFFFSFFCYLALKQKVK